MAIATRKANPNRLPALRSASRGYSVSSLFCWAGRASNRLLAWIAGSENAGFAKTHAGLAAFTFHRIRVVQPLSRGRLFSGVGEMTGDRVNASREAIKRQNANGRQDKKSEQHNCSREDGVG